MAISAETLQKMEALPADKLRIVETLIDQFSKTASEPDVAGPVLTQSEIDKLIAAIQASMKAG